MSESTPLSSSRLDVAGRIAALEWGRITESVRELGYATLPTVLTPDECSDLIAFYPERDRFRSRIDMSRFRFGVGEYKYFAAPLPLIVGAIRETLYARVAPIANESMQALRSEIRFPPDLRAFLKRCHREGQIKPTPLMLRYESGGYNCMHQDLYGEIAFPLQFTFMLSREGVDYTGGEFVLLEQRPRAQSRVNVITLQQGEGVLFSTRYRPVQGARGFYRANVRHGVSVVHGGLRFTLGIIFHDAK